MILTKRNIWERLLAVLLSMAMTIALLPATVLAAEPDSTAEQITIQEVQALIDALPDAEAITADNRADVEGQLAAIDEAKLRLNDEEVDALDITHYLAAVEALLALDDMAGADDMPATIAFLEGLTGDGKSEDSPYQIESAEQLKALSEFVNNGNSCANTYFKLMNDIDLGCNEGNQWVPIGNSDNSFLGTFDGNGHTVYGLYIDNTYFNYYTVGLFGYIGSSGTVKDLGINGNINAGGIYDAGGIAGISWGVIIGCHSDCNIYYGDRVGGIVGYSNGTVEDCYNVGDISRASDAGGIVGVASGTNSKVIGCYNTGTVTGSNAGGIAGRSISRASIENCYNVGAVTGTSSCGGIAGKNESECSITRCYYLDSDDDGVGSNSGGTESIESKSAEEFKSLADTLGEGWTDDPFLGRPVRDTNREPSTVAGGGTEEDPYLIPDKEALEIVRDYINSSADGGLGMVFQMTYNIDLENEPWTPIGNSSKPFSGTFDGGGHTISGLNINTNSGSLGLFGALSGGAVKNLTVDGTVIGDGTCAGIVAENKGGTVENCHNLCSITAASIGGGIVGKNESGTIKNCYNTGSISGEDGAGGIVGDNDSGTVENCCNVGNVSGSNIGGIAGLDGENDSTVNNCYYLSGTAGNGAGSSDGRGMEKTSAQFTSGEVAYLLQKSQSPQVWGQAVGAGYPELTDDPSKTVYQITGNVEDQDPIVWYSNSKVILPVEKPSKKGFAFAGWSKESGGEADFTYGETIGGDTTVYAVWKIPFEGSGTNQEPYLIPDLAALEAFRDYINIQSEGSGNYGSDEYFQLTATIDMSSEYGDGRKFWTPIVCFNGILSGGGYSISGLYCCNPEYESPVGLFETIGSSGVVSSLHVSGSVIGEEATNVGGIAGLNQGTITDCEFSGAVKGKQYVGGIAGVNQGVISHCRNNGYVKSIENYSGGIAGYNQEGALPGGFIENCYNTGKVESTGNAGGISVLNANGSGSDSEVRISNCYNIGPVQGKTSGGIAAGNDEGSIINCYYIDTCGAAGEGTQKSEGEFASGEVSYLLQSGQNTQAWGQGLQGSLDEYPVLTKASEKAVYKVTFTTQNDSDYAARYTNYGGTVALPKDPALSGMVFDHWSLTQSTASGGLFDANTPVTADTTVYAVGRQTFGGETIVLAMDYGESKTVNLSQYVQYESGTEAVGKFTYTIKDGNEKLNASIDGDTLVIPAEAAAGEYTLTIQAEEKSPQYSLLSIDSFGTDPVLLTVELTIENVDAHVDIAPVAVKDLTYTGAGQELVTAGSATGGTMQYSLDGSIYSSNIPNGTDAKVYTVWYKVAGDDNHNDTAAQSLTVSIGKAEPSVIKEPAPINGVYDGADHPLVEAGSAEGGTILYSLEQDGEYSDAIPNSQGAGEYTVWYKVAGDANHKDSEPQPVTVTIEKGEGKGSVSIANYLCTQTDVNPVPQSDTNGTDNVTYTYTAKSEENYSVVKPITAGEYTVKAEFTETNNYNAFVATADFTINHHYNSWEEDPDGYHNTCPCSTDVRLQETGLTEVPDGLKNIEALNTVEKITRVLVEEIKKGSSIPDRNTVVYDVRLQVKNGDSEWVDVTPENFPEEGITVIITYPKGTDSSYTFTIIHLITTGENAGKMEKLEPTNTEGGVSFTVYSLSPICVGWTATSGSIDPPSFFAPTPTYYDVSISSDVEGGSVTADRVTAEEGSEVTLTVTPDEGYHCSSLTVVDGNGNTVELTDNGDGTYTFKQPRGTVTVEAGFVKCSSLAYSDLDLDVWYHEHTDYVISHGLMQGIGSSLFAPDVTVSRAEMVTVLWNLRGQPVVNYYMTYSDVTEGTWYAEAVRWATSERIVSGYGNGAFGPDEPISREQMATMIYRYEQKYGDGGFTGNWMYRLPFTDLDQISDWAFEAVAWCNMKGIISGKPDSLYDPKGTTKRSEMAAVITMYLTWEE